VKKPRTVTRRWQALGVNALAREIGAAQSTVSLKMRQGMSADQIRAWAATREGASPPKYRKEKPSSGSMKQSTPAGSQSEPPPAPESDYEMILRGRQRLEDIDEAKLRRARALADGQELENAQRRGELIPVAHVRLWATRFLVSARDELLKGPGELQDALAAETDPVRCAGIVRAWTERVLGKFHNLERLWGALDDERVA
jgi:hypothetical protein